MKIEETSFGSITINGKKYNHDIVVLPHTKEKRKKWITKEKHGTSHKFTREEMEEYLSEVENPEQIEVVIVGTGQYDKLRLLAEAEKCLKGKGIRIVQRETPKAIEKFEESDIPREKKIGIFHVTC